jgi:hypothetical protein
MVSVAETAGVGEGLTDFQFGNNVQMMKGRSYTVRHRRSTGGSARSYGLEAGERSARFKPIGRAALLRPSGHRVAGLDA